MGELTTPEKFHLRCPACNKLYVVASADIANETPEFDCVSCQQRFFFNYPPVDFASIPTLLIEKPFIQAESHDAAVQNMHQQEFMTPPALEAQKACPKCGALNQKSGRECYSCHVIFEKLEGLPKDKTLNAQPSLVRKWRELVEDFSNDEKHEDFLISCHQLDALKFAQSKYQTMKEALGEDETCERMLTRLDAMLIVGMKSPKMKGGVSAKPQRPTWMKWFFIGPFATSALMVLIGALNLNHRNMIGGGFALAFCAAGLIMMIKGRISYDDFK